MIQINADLVCFVFWGKYRTNFFKSIEISEFSWRVQNTHKNERRVKNSKKKVEVAQAGARMAEIGKNILYGVRGLERKKIKFLKS